MSNSHERKIDLFQESLNNKILNHTSWKKYRRVLPEVEHLMFAFTMS